MELSGKSIQFSQLQEFEQFSSLVGQPIEMLGSKTSMFVLAKDIRNGQNAMLCPAGLKLDNKLFSRLKTVSETCKANKLTLDIAKSAGIAEQMKKIILDAVEGQITASRYLNKLGSSLFLQYRADLMRIAVKVFSNHELIYAFFDDHCRRPHPKYLFKGFVPQLNEGISQALFACSIELDGKPAPPDAFLQQLFTTSLIYALIHIDFDPRNKPGNSFKLGRRLIEYTRRLHLPRSIATGVWQLVKARTCNYFEFNRRNDPLSRIVQNLWLTKQYVALIMGGKGKEPLSPNAAISAVFSLSRKGMISENYVEKLSKWLEKHAIFRLSRELDRIYNMCNRGEGGTSLAHAYPVNIETLPRMFICTQQNHACPHLAPGESQIHVTQRTPKLKSGAYSKCSLLTSALHMYYKDELPRIKNELSKRK